MKVRLGFSIASQIRPDIVLIDEVLAVGDLGFKAKCYNEIYKILENAAIIFVSHSMPQVAKVCTKGILLRNGRVVNNSKNISEIIYNYFNEFEGEKLSVEGSKKIQLLEIGIGQASMSFFDDPINSEPIKTFELDHKAHCKLFFRYIAQEECDDFAVLISVIDGEQKLVSQSVSPVQNKILKNEIRVIEFNWSVDYYNSGQYSLSIHFLQNQASTDWGETLFGVRNILKFGIKRESFIGSSPILLNGRWTTTNQSIFL